jgi:hypothetical protein
VIRSLPAQPVTIRRDGVARYVEAIGWLTLEVSRTPKLLPLFWAILKLAPSTIETLRSEQRKLAA